MRQPSAVRRPLLRALLVLALAVVAGGAWFGLLTTQAKPTLPGEVAAPSDSRAPDGTGVPQPDSTASPTPAPSPTPTPSPERVTTPGLGVLPTSQPGATFTLTPSGPVVEMPSPGPATASSATRQALSLRLDSLRATYGLPGASAAILFADGSIWRGTSGLADVATKRPVTPDTEFAVASISKTFLAALILKFVEEGELELDSPVATYLPDLTLDKAITVRRLLDHTSGLHDFFYDPDIDEALLADRDRVWTIEEVMAFVGKPFFKPGKGWQYSNTNYVILGMLAERIAAQPLADQLRARFLAPLGLDHTHYQGVDDPLGPLARAYRFNGPGLDLAPIPLTDGTNVVPFTSVVTAAGSAGSIASTAEDLVTWARALYAGGALSP